MIKFKPITVGLASYGMSGKVFHAPFLKVNPRFQLKTIVQRSSTTAKNDYPDVEVVQRFEQLLEDEALDLIIVNTPNELHYDMAKSALSAGKHVVIEKPITPTSEEARKLIQLASEKKRVLTVYQNRRWDSDFLTVQKVLKNKLLGRLVEYEAHYDRYVQLRDPESWKAKSGPGSGILYNLGAHMIDQALVLFGRPTSITAIIGTHREGSQIDDFYDIALHYGDFRAILKSSYVVRELGPRYTLHGTSGSFVKYGTDPQEEALNAGEMPDQADWGQEPAEGWGKLNAEINGLDFTGQIASIPGSYGHFYENLYEAIREGRNPAVLAGEAADVIELIELAYQSSELGKTIPVHP